MSNIKYLAHVEPENNREQTIIEHLLNTAQKAHTFADVFDAGDEAYRCGILHDIGKYSMAFQRRIRGNSERTDHSTAGTLEAAALGDVPSAFCIAGHHGGLPNLGNRKTDTANDPTLFGKLKRITGKDIEDYSTFRDEVPATLPTVLPQRFDEDNIGRYFFTKMLYSCLVDADFLDTEEFISNKEVFRGHYEGLTIYRNKLDEYIAPWWNAENEMNKTRCSVLRTQIDNGKTEKKGLFSLTVPTGGGKTVSSMAFALEHAEANGLSRIIYVIPYTSIIEQTQDVFEKMFGEGSVVAHYSNAEYGNEHIDEIKRKQYLATENWDAPIVLTTAVQFFESLYASKSSKNRKLHNIANSVIIFDEAQMLPVPFLVPCVTVIAQLVKNYGCSAVLCTATQPALNPLFEKALPEQPVRMLFPQNFSKLDVFRRVIFRQEGMISNEDLAEKLNSEKQVLCIVNNRKQAQKLFLLLEGDGPFHLSTMMYPEHRRSVLKEIRNSLNNGRPCRVVSTSLIEAGVDVDFPTVYRAMAGLDSIIQAAGRCNREGKRLPEDSIVHIFDSEQKPPPTLEQNVLATRRVLAKHENIASADAVKDYFTFLLYMLKDESALDNRGIVKSIESGSMAFREIGERFRIIEGCENTIYIPLGNGSLLAKQLAIGGPTKSLMRKLGQYSVGVYENHFKKLLKAGAIEVVSENAAVLRDLSLYSEKTGLSFGIDEGKGIFI